MNWARALSERQLNTVFILHPRLMAPLLSFVSENQATFLPDCVYNACQATLKHLTVIMYQKPWTLLRCMAA